MASVAPEAGELAPEGALAPEKKRPWKLCSETMQVKVIVIVLTVVMAAFEVGDRILVVDFVGSFFVVISLDLFEQVGVGGAILGVLLAVSCVAAVVWGSRKIEAMEAHAVLFDDASKKILGEATIGPPSRKAPDLRQASDDIDELMGAAAAVFPAFQSDVLQRLVADGSRYECNLKTRERVREKVKIEYNGDAAKIKDLCRGLVVAETLPALEASCAALQKLSNVEILQVKNRLRDPPEGDGPTASGYRDLNVNIRFQKHICEIQIIHAELLKLKTNQAPVYNLVRSLGLVGPLPEATAPETRRRPPKRTRAALAVLRIFMARFAAAQGMNYVTNGYGTDVGLANAGQVLLRTMTAPGLVYAAVMAPPYFFCAFLLLRDLLAQFDSTRWRVAAVAAVWVLQFASESGLALYTAMQNLADGSPLALVFAALYIFGCVFVVPCLAAAAAVSLRRRGRKTHVSRVALLYQKYLGLRGMYYRWKILGLQYATVILQAFAKLPEMGALVSTQSHFGDNAVVDLKGAPSPPAYWFFFVMLTINALYPGALYYYAARSSSRDADTVAALCDVTLDLSYSMGWVFVTKQFFRLCRWTPVEVFQTLGLFTPCVHLLFTCRAVEAAAAADQKTPATAKQPSKKACAGHALLSVATLAVIMVVSCRDRYPFKAQSRCNPCECEGSVLTSCKLAGVARVWSLDLSDKGITEVRSDAFKDIKYTLLNVWLDDNKGLMSLPPDVFDELDVLMNLSLMRTGVTELPSLAGKKYFENLFLDGMNVSSISGDTLAGSRLRFVHATNMPNFQLDAATFARTRQLEAVWIGGSNTNCVELPHEAACVDHRCRFIEELDAEYFIYREFQKDTCEASYDGAPGCGEIPCLPRSCFVPS
jgi:hypothetical protein